MTAGFRAAAGVIAVGMLLLAGCGSGDEKAPAEAAPTTSATDLQGTWRADPISPADAENTLREHGLEKWIADFRGQSPIGPDTVLTLVIGQEEWDLYGSSGGQAREKIDYADCKVSGDRVEVIHDAGTNTYTWSVEGDTLTIRWLSTTFPAHEGIPEEVFQRALYMTASFTRVAS